MGRADLVGADLTGAIGIATHDDAVAMLDRIREIVLSHTERLEMGRWHGEGWVENKPAADEIDCGTTHCMAGWSQVLCEDPSVRKLAASVAGSRLIWPAVKMFTESNSRALEFLRDREYAK